MSTAIAKTQHNEAVIYKGYTAEQSHLLRTQIAVKATPDEMQLFLYVCEKRNLDPFARQIYCIHRNAWNSDTGRKEPKLTMQVSIDGLRAIADRTGTYCPGDETWVDGSDGYPVSATVSVRKLVAGTWQTFSATAHFSEYAQPSYSQKAGGSPYSDMWATKPHVMIAKCAEAKALRKGWSESLGDLYAPEEMDKTEERDTFHALAAVQAPAAEQALPAPTIVAAPSQTVTLPPPQKKTAAPAIPPLADKITAIPGELLQYLPELKQYADVPLDMMVIEDLELVIAACKTHSPRWRSELGRSWLTSIQATAQHHLGEVRALDGVP